MEVAVILLEMFKCEKVEKASVAANLDASKETVKDKQKEVAALKEKNQETREEAFGVRKGGCS